MHEVNKYFFKNYLYSTIIFVIKQKFQEMVDWLQIKLFQRSTHTHTHNRHITLLFEETEQTIRHRKFINQDCKKMEAQRGVLRIGLSFLQISFK